MFRPFARLASYGETLDALLQLLPPPKAEAVPLETAHGRTLAADLAAPADVPAFDRCAFDGYAVRSADVARASPASPVTLPVVAVAHAGDARRTLRAGEAVQVATGAILPEGADAVVAAEQTARRAAQVEIRAAAPPGQHVSARGGDLRAGQRVLSSGRRVDAGALALAASLGASSLPCAARPRVAILPSGSEVIQPGTPLAAGQVYDSNSRALAAIVERLGGIPDRRPPMADEPEAHRSALAAAAASADLVLTTGGTSVGERDLMAGLLTAHGEVSVHGVRLRPGRPVLVGRWGASPFLGLPGYPASTLVTAEMLLAPALRRMLGDRTERPARAAAWGHEVAVREDLTTVLPVRIRHGVAESVYKESGTVTSVTDSDGYALFVEGSRGAVKGAAAEVHPWSWS